MIKAAETPTLRDIAQAVGVTPTTVSLALRDSPRISSQTRNRVRQTAEDMGYRPNAELSRMMANLKTRQGRDLRPVIALVTTAQGTVRGFVQSIAEAAGYSLDVIDVSQRGMGIERIAGVLRARGIRGAILHRLEYGEPASGEWMDELALCCVGQPPSGSTLASCEWAPNAGSKSQDEPLLEAALDWLDLALRRNRFGPKSFGVSIQLT
jgi:DNA-binding LacI/PurR family transcriptional regulator